MFKKIFFLLFFFFFYLLVLPVKAEFNRYQNNPIIKPDKPYDGQGVYAPSLVYKNGQYYMWYSSLQGGTWTISLATSTDGISWTKSPANPVIKPDTTNPVICEKGAHDPEVLWNPNLNKFQLWYVVNCEPQPTGVARYWVKYGQSTDGINWTIQQTPVLSPTLSWEQEGISFPTVGLDNNVYKIWYSGRDSSGNWRIGYATSADGKTWNKYQQNPIISPTKPWELSHIGGSEVIFENGRYTMYYHGAPIWPPLNLIYATSSDGITWEKPDDNPIITANQTETNVSTPDVIKDNQGYKIYYSAIINGVFQISLLSNNSISQQSPVILIPGFLASWNKEAILHNKATNFSQWQLNPMVKEYQGIKTTFNNLGYINNQDFFIFAYDWRKGLNDLADDLNNYIDQLPNLTNKQFSLIGHSLGGLVSRVYLQKYRPTNINKVITIGSPHQGTAKAYKPVEAGEIERENNLLWLAEKIILVLNKNSFETNKETIGKLLPGAKDLLPIYNFLKNETGQEISISAMKIKNDTLLFYQNDIPNFSDFIDPIAGEKDDTLFGFKVKQRTILDQLLDLYPDGRPIDNYYRIGDRVVVSNSAKIGDNPTVLSLDHGELVYKSQGIKKILDQLAINYQNNQIVEGEKTKIFPSLIFLLKSPAEMEVEFNGETFYENEGMIFIEDAQAGSYTLKVKGKEKGRYTVVIGQITDENDSWSTIEGEIGKTPPTSQTDVYNFNFNPNSGQFVPLDQSLLFDELILYLTDLNRRLKETEITRAITNLNKGKQFYQQNNKGRVKSYLQLTHQQLFKARGQTDEQGKKELLSAIEKLENLYQNVVPNYRFGISSWRLKRNLTRYEKIIAPTERYLLSQKQRGKNVVKNANILLEIEKRLNLAEKKLTENQLIEAEILLKSVAELIREVRRL